MRIDKKEPALNKDVTKHWEIASHCSLDKYPAAYPELLFDTESCNFLYRQYVTSCNPASELAQALRQAHYRVLDRLNRSKLQVKNFILPVQLIKLKHIDPFSRQQIVGKICNYLRSQLCLKNVVLEQAGVSLTDLIRLLLSISGNAQIRRLFLWHALDQCESPFKGPLRSFTVNVNLDNLPRIPYTFQPGGRKFLKQIERMKLEEQSKPKVNNITSDKKVILDENRSQSYGSSISGGKVFTQVSVEVQCESQNDTFSNSPSSLGGDINAQKDNVSKMQSMVDCCMDYLKLYENSSISIDSKIQLYKIALNGLVNVTTLSLNYCLLADGTGSALMSIGSVLNGTLRNLEILCVFKDLPSEDHKQYYPDANHAIPDVTWRKVKEKCPSLKVHMILVSLLPHDVTKMFVTKSIPLHTFIVDSGFCTTLIKPQIAFFCTIKFLNHYFKATLEKVNILIWHSFGRIDSSLEKLLIELRLRSFTYYGPLQYKATINKLCDAALLPTSNLVVFKLVVRGDPCYPHIAEELTAKLYQQYKPLFLMKNIQFTLTSCSSNNEIN